LEFAEFGGFGIVREWILILTQEVRDGESRKKHGEDCEPETAERDPSKLSAESLNFVRFVQDRHTVEPPVVLAESRPLYHSRGLRCAHDGQRRHRRAAAVEEGEKQGSPRNGSHLAALRPLASGFE
jgi:hypothetical protein